MTGHLTSSSPRYPSHGGTILEAVLYSHYSLLIWHVEKERRTVRQGKSERERERKQWHYLLFGRHSNGALGLLGNAFYCSFIIQWFLNRGRKWNIYIEGQMAVSGLLVWYVAYQDVMETHTHTHMDARGISNGVSGDMQWSWGKPTDF